MRILFIGSILPESAETRLKCISNAGNRFQLNLINSLRMSGHDVSLCSYIGFPVEEDYLSEFTEQHKEVEKGCYRKDRDSYVFKSISGLGAVSVYKKRYCDMLDEIQPDICICYNPVYAWWEITRILHAKGIKSVLILADYTGAEGVGFSLRYPVNLLKSRLELKCIRSFDKVVGLSAQVKSYLKQSTDFIHVEGGVVWSKWIDFPKPDMDVNVRRFMYSGLLSPVAGVDIAVEASEKIEAENTELIITGNGELSDWIRERAAKDKRIRFLGRLEYEEYIKCLSKSHILLNPRNMSLPENKNNFPSKMLDYLATGRSIVSTRFSGWEHFEKNAVFTDSDVSDFADGMRTALADFDKLFVEIYQNNRLFAEKYDWRMQAERIIQ